MKTPLVRLSLAALVVMLAGAVALFLHATPARSAKRPPLSASRGQPALDEGQATPTSPQQRFAAPLPAATSSSARAEGAAPLAAVGSAAGTDPVHHTLFNEVPEAEIPTHVQTFFEAEPVAPGWARGARSSLFEKLDHVSLPGAQVEAIECRSATCKVTVNFPDRSLQQAYFEKAYVGGGAAIAELRMAMYAHLTDTADGVKSEVYLFKDGFP